MGTKRPKRFLHQHTNSASKKCWEKIVEKSAKNVFLYSHEYRDQKIGGTKRAKQFFQKHTISESKNVWKKIFGRKCENVFLYTHEYRDKKWWEQNARNNFCINSLIV